MLGEKSCRLVGTIYTRGDRREPGCLELARNSTRSSLFLARARAPLGSGCAIAKAEKSRSVTVFWGERLIFDGATVLVSGLFYVFSVGRATCADVLGIF